MSSHIRHKNMTRDEAAQSLADALHEAFYAQVRFNTRTRVIGFHGEDFEQRWLRVQRIVTAHNDQAVRAARKRAIGAGWSETELTSSRPPTGYGSSRVT